MCREEDLLQLLPELAQNREAVATLTAAAIPRLYKPGTVFVRAGTSADHLVGLLEGEVDVLGRIGQTERTIGRLGAGILLGEAALVPGLRRTASLRAHTRVRALELPAAIFREVMLKNPQLIISLFETVMRRLQSRDDAYLRALHQGIVSRDKELAQLRAHHVHTADPEGVWCPSLEPLLTRARRLARSDLPVLIVGESGTGKELLATYLHRHSDRARRKLRSLNCAAIPAEIAEAELFGVTKGAYTGAVQDRIGLLKAADGGTLFLDEIGDLPLAQQAKLLRALQDGTYYPVGSQSQQRTDVRLVSATNKDLRSEVNAGRFREDLLYRIEGARLDLPPLRERRDHIPILVEWVLQRALPDVEPAWAAQEIMPVLLRYAWPGNVRELISVLKAGIALTDDFPRLQIGDLPATLRPAVREGDFAMTPAEGRSGSFAAAGALSERLCGQSLTEHLRHVTVGLIRLALQENDWVRKDAAAMLGMTPQNLSNYIRRLGIELQNRHGD